MQQIGTLKDEPLVSVIIPTYNDAATLADAINSALNQTYTTIEVILVDDGSDDEGRTKQIAAEFGDKIVFLSVTHRGVAAARNVGIDIAKGTYVAFLDADDLFHPDKIEKQICYMVENNLHFCHSSYNVIRFSGESLGVKNTKINSGWNYPCIIQGCLIATPTVIIQKESLGSFRFCESISIGEDNCLWIDLAAEMELGHIDEPLSDVRISGDSAGYNPKKTMLGLANIIQYLLCDETHAENLREIRRLVGFLEHANDEAILEKSFGEGEATVLYASHSWRLTRPIRALLYAFRTPGITFKESLSRLKYYWKNKKLDMRSDSDIRNSPYWKVTRIFRSIAALFQSTKKNEE